jgi:uroporphyrinogen III methyltransferase/synthase
MAAPLLGKRILITRPEEQGKEWGRELEALGAEVVELPLIHLTPSPLPLERGQIRLSEFDWIVFSSSNAVRFFKEVANQDLPKDIKVAVVGPATKEACEKHEWEVSFIPSEFTARALAEQLPDVQGRQVLFPTTDLARDEILAILTERGALVEKLVVYKTEKALDKGPELTNIISQGVDVLTFASPSAVECFAELTGDKSKEIPAACIGPSTAERAMELGLKEIIRTKENTVTGLTNAIIEFFGHEKPSAQA